MNRVHPEKFSDTDEHARRGVSAEELQTLKDLLKRLLQEGDDPDEDDSKVARDERNANEDAELEAEQPSIMAQPSQYHWTREVQFCQQYVPDDVWPKRCKSCWTTVGIVSALLGSISLTPLYNSMSGAMTMDGPSDLWTDQWLRSLLFISVLAFLCNIIVILMSTFFFVYIDHVYGKLGVRRFIRDWISGIMTIPIVFALGCSLNVAQVLIVVAYTTGVNTLFYVLAALTAIVAVYLCSLAIILTFYVGRYSAYESLMEKQNEK